jgi:uncharacterized protein YbbK (DUF523 family)
MEKILVSSCLLGHNVRYHAGNAYCANPILECWLRNGQIIAFCPEVAAGLPIPRPSCEIVGGDGYQVIAGLAKVISHTGIDRTSEFLNGAYLALELVKHYNIKLAIMKNNSPSCGNHIYDGTFSGKVIDGFGTTAALLTTHGVTVFNELEINAADAYLATL